MKTWITQLVLLTSVLFSLPLWAASFDCQSAVSTDEKTICLTHQLNDQDVEMSVKYHFLKGLLPMGEQGDMADTQRIWLKKRQACGSDVGCLTEQYQQRISQLDKLYTSINKPL